MTQAKYINIRFDNVLAPRYFYAVSKTKCKLIGERWGTYVVQFNSLASAKRAINAYRKYAESLGYCKTANDYTTAICADIGNHSAWHVSKLAELSESYFYLNA